MHIELNAAAPFFVLPQGRRSLASTSGPALSLRHSRFRGNDDNKNCANIPFAVALLRKAGGETKRTCLDLGACFHGNDERERSWRRRCPSSPSTRPMRPG